MTQEEIGLKFGIKKNTVCDILKDKEKWLNIKLTGSNTTKQKQKSAKFPELKEALAIWISKALAANKTITGEIIIAKAINFANLLNIEGFTGSSGWLSNFKKRYNIKQYNKHGEAQSGPSEEELDKEREKLQELISNYDIKNVFNCDETKVVGRNPFGISRNVETSLSDVSTDDETFRHRQNVKTMRNVKTSAIRFNQSK